MNTIVIASGNPSKVERYSRFLKTYFAEVVGLKELGITKKPDEYGETAEENAEIKSKYYSKISGLPVFSEDEALYVDFLTSELQPGVHVRRINRKEDATDNELLQYWENILLRIPKEKRTGHWHVAYSVSIPAGITKTVAVDVPVLFFSPTSKVILPGWPLSSLQGPAVFNKPHSELSEGEKNKHEEKSNLLIAEKLEELIKELNLAKKIV